MNAQRRRGTERAVNGSCQVLMSCIKCRYSPCRAHAAASTPARASCIFPYFPTPHHVNVARARPPSCRPCHRER